MYSRSGHITNHSQLSYLVKTQYYVSFDKREQIINFGQKPIELPFERRVWSRDVKRLKYYNDKPFILDEARRYQEYLERNDVNTRAEIAEIFGVSRARIIQYLNLLKLPKPIIKYVERNRHNNKITFTERKLRPLTWTKDQEKCIKNFNKIISDTL